MGVFAGLGLAAILLLSACSPPTNSNAEIRLTCGTIARFDEADLRMGIEAAGDAPGRALTAFLASREANRAQLPVWGWRRVSEAPGVVLFVAPRNGPDVPLVMVELVRNGDLWLADTWGECRPRFLSDTKRAGSWDLASTPQRSAQRIDVLVTDPECSEAPLTVGQILPSTIHYGDQSVIVTIWIGRSAAVDTARGCPGLPPLTYSIDLDEPLGQRTLFDGGVLPARAVQPAVPFDNPGDASPGPDLR